MFAKFGVAADEPLLVIEAAVPLPSASPSESLTPLAAVAPELPDAVEVDAEDDDAVVWWACGHG
jgi:hypothetical protein